jgi:hypothetical protein
MSGKAPKDKSPEQSLALLLDALATELLAAPDHEVAVTLWDLDATGRNALKAARRLVTSFNDSSESPIASNVISPGPRIHVAPEH